MMKTPQQQSSWSQLNQTYHKWQEMQAKGRLRMRKKANKDKQQYYDFDFSRYQYFYSYPEKHISLAHPNLQKSFVNRFIDQSTQDFSANYLGIDDFLHPQKSGKDFIEYMKLYELKDFLKDANQAFSEKIVMLRIEKTLLIHQGNSENSLIDLIQSEIRSYVVKKIRIADEGDLGTSSNKKQAQLKNSLKTRKFDEFRFTNISKGDLTVFLRMLLTEQKLAYNMEKLKTQIELQFQAKKWKIMQRADQIKVERFQQVREKSTRLMEQIMQRIRQTISREDHLHFQNYSNETFLKKMVNEFNYPCLLAHQNSSAVLHPQLLPIFKHYSEVPYIPCCYQDLQRISQELLQYYFPDSIIDDIRKNSKDYLCYKMNNFFSIQFRILTESYSYVNPVKQKEVMVVRQLMNKELETVFSKDVDKLLNVERHQIIILVDEGGLQILSPFQRTERKRTKKQSICQQTLNNCIYSDPTIKYLIALLQANSQKLVHQQVYKYVQEVLQTSKHKWFYQRLFYINVHQSQKMHLIRVINAHLQETEAMDDYRVSVYLQTLDQSVQLDQSLLESLYSMSLLRCMQNRNKLINIINAQVCLMYRVQYKIALLKFKSQLPFQMNPQFLRRFTYTNRDEDPFDFTTAEKVRSQPYPVDNVDTVLVLNHDKHNVEVRRNNPENPLYEGKKIIYQQTLKQVNTLFQKIGKIASYLIERRENFLHQQAFTYLVDRVRLLCDIVKSQEEYQFAKLQLLIEYEKIMQKTVSPQGIIQSVQFMKEAKERQFIFDTTQMCFYESYQNQTTILKNKSSILKHLSKLQKQIQEKQSREFKQRSLHSNLNTLFPELSCTLFSIKAIYYEEEMMIEQEEEEDDDKASMAASESQKSDNEVLLGVRNASDVTNTSFTGSQYHLKTSFQQILRKGTVTTIKTDNAKKQQLLNRKRKRLISDSVLGGLLRDNRKHSFSAHYVYQVMDVVENLFDADNLSDQFGVASTSVILEKIQAFIGIDISSRQIFSCEYLPVLFSQTAKLIEKVRSPTYSQIQHYLCFGPKLLQDLLKSNQPDCTELRGLYLALNYIHTTKLHYGSLLLQTEIKQVSHILDEQLVNYSGSMLSELQQGIIQNYAVQKDKIISQASVINRLYNNRQPYLLAINEYQLYFRAAITFNSNTTKLYRYIAKTFHESIAKFQSLKRQVNFISQYNGYADQKLYILRQLPNILNKLILNKRQLQLYQAKTQVLKKEEVKQHLRLVSSTIDKIYPYKQQILSSEANLLQNSRNFHLRIMSILEGAYKLSIYCKEILASNLNNTEQLIKVKYYLQIMPYLKKKLKVKFQPNYTLNGIFSLQGDKQSQKESGQTKVMRQNVLRCSDLKNIKLESVREAFKHWIQKHFITKRYPQLRDQERKNQLNTYIEEYSSIQTDMTLIDKMPLPILQQVLSYQRVVSFRQWLQINILVLGCQLSEKQMLQLRLVLNNSSQLFPVFFQDNTEHILKPTQLHQMLSLDSSQNVLKSYYQNYYTIISLKKTYLRFLDEVTDRFEGFQVYSLLPFYKFLNQYFEKDQSTNQYAFLFLFGQMKEPTSEIQTLLKSVFDKNPRDSQKRYSFFSLTQAVWRKPQAIRRQLTKFIERTSYEVSYLNNHRGIKVNPLINESYLVLYKHERLKQILQIFSADLTQETLNTQLQIFHKNSLVDIERGKISLNNSQRTFWNFSEKLSEKTIEFTRIKDSYIKVLLESKFYEQILLEKIYSMSVKVLQSQLELKKCLAVNFTDHYKFTYEKTLIKQTLNSVLAPKVKLNPFLESPLKLQNYFFAGTYKLAYVDSFLTKLKNRAVLIQLAEGGFGFLLKINELDECVNHLCKLLMGFSEKEFGDRFRTFLQAYEDLKENYTKTMSQLRHLKDLNKILKQRQAKHIESLMYKQTQEYLNVFTSKQKTYLQLIKVIKGLEAKYAEQYHHKYQSQINDLKLQNERLKRECQEYKERVSQAFGNAIHQSKDILCNNFKKKVEGVLKKPFRSASHDEDDEQIFGSILEKSTLKHLPSQKFEPVQQKESEIIMRKMHQQKAFFEMKLNSVCRKADRKISQLQTVVSQQKKIHANYLEQTAKNKVLQEEIQNLRSKAIQVEQLKAQKKAKEEEQTLQRFRLIRVNQALQGKLQRIEKKSKEGSESKDKIELRSATSQTAIQTFDNSNHKKPSFRIKTQPSIFPRADEIGIWRTKWENCETKYQDLAEKVRKISQNFRFTKNYNKLAENVLKLVDNITTDRAKISMVYK